jgi:transposase
MPIVAQTYEHVMGADTHARSNTLALVSAPTGELLDTRTFPNTAAGLSRAIAWTLRRDPQALLVTQGIGSYGAALAKEATGAGLAVAEASAMPARRGAKDDEADARRIALCVLGTDTAALRRPRASEGVRAAVRILLSSREHLATERTRAINALLAMLRTIDLGIETRRPLGRVQIAQIAAWRQREEPQERTVARREAVRMARRIQTCDRELKDNKAELEALVRDSPAARLLEQTGSGPISAAVALASWSHPGRIRSEAAFAALSGTNPIPASSGNTVRHRLNRRGDRRLNSALHTIALTRMRCDPRAREYVARRTAEGRTLREIRRCLKRYIARELYRLLEQGAAPA